MGELAPGVVFAGHRIEEMAGRGGMGVVYRATHVALGRTVALKVIAPELIEDEATRQRFLRESKIAASLDHPNVIPVYYAGEEDGVGYLAMRFVRGEDLRSLVRGGGPLEPRRAARLVGQVAAALDAAHASGLVHRDVKPANILLAASDHVYLSDFGLSKHTLSVDGETRSGHWVGTLDYVAPEQIRGERIDARVDVYALGCVLHFALTGRPPFERDSDQAKLWAHLSAPPPRPTDVVPGLPPEFDEVVARALAKRPADRFPSAGDLGRAALAATGESDVRLRERAVGVGAAALDEAPTESTSGPEGVPASEAPTRQQQPPRRRRRALLAGAAAVLVAGGIGVALAVDGSGGGSGQTAAAPPDPTAAPAPEVDATVNVADRPNAVAVADGTVFVTHRDEPRLTLIDEKTAERRRRRPEVGLGSVELAKDRRGVWVALSTGHALVELDPGSGRELTRIDLPSPARSVATRSGAVWVGLAATDPGMPETLARVDPDSGRIAASYPVMGRIRSLVATPSGVWILHRDRPQMTRRDPATGAVEKRLSIGTTQLGDAVYGAGAVWVTSPQEDTVSRIDDRTGRKVSSLVGSRPNGIAARASQVWVSSFIEHTITRIDPRTARPAGRPVEVPLNPYALAITPDSVWVTAVAEGEVARVRYGDR